MILGLFTSHLELNPGLIGKTLRYHWIEKLKHPILSFKPTSTDEISRKSHESVKFDFKF